MPDFHAGAQKYQPINMRYSADWNDDAKAGLVVPKTDTQKIFFFLINKKTRATELTLDDDDPTEIEWLDEDEGQIQVALNSEDTQAIAAGEKQYEVWALLTSGSKALVDDGEFKLLASKAASVVP